MMDPHRGCPAVLEDEVVTIGVCTNGVWISTGALCSVQAFLVELRSIDVRYSLSSGQDYGTQDFQSWTLHSIMAALRRTFRTQPIIQDHRARPSIALAKGYYCSVAKLPGSVASLTSLGPNLGQAEAEKDFRRRPYCIRQSRIL